MKALVFLAISILFAGAALAAGGGKHDHGANASTSGEDYPFGRAGNPKKATRTVRIEMSDKMRYSPSNLRVRRGETVKFVVVNRGKVMHEMVLGTMVGLKEHAEAMKKHPGMEHDDPYGAEVDPGKTGTLVWQFTKEGKFYFGCLVPGHFEAGMIGEVTVTK